MNLKALTQLSASEDSSIVLRSDELGHLRYYIISSTTNYSIVLEGHCEGEIPDDRPISFNIVLGSVAPLVDRGVEFYLKYDNGSLLFKTLDNSIVIHPLCVEHVSKNLMELLDNYIKFTAALRNLESTSTEIDKLRVKIETLETKKSSFILDNFVPSTNDPFGNSDTDSKVDDFLEGLDSELKELRRNIATLSSRTVNMSPIENMDEFRRISTIAARHNKVVSMCGKFAVVQLTSGYIFQKCECGVRAVQGKLLSKLLAIKDGKFFDYEGSMVFHAKDNRTKDDSTTTVFISAFMPSTKADETLITKGTVKEKYRLQLKSIFKTVSPILSKFDIMELDMGNARLLLTNEGGESVAVKFDVSDAKTLELNKLMRGEEAGEITMSIIPIPKELHTVLHHFDENFTVYVKKNKYIIQSEGLYAVFGG